MAAQSNAPSPVAVPGPGRGWQSLELPQRPGDIRLLGLTNETYVTVMGCQIEIGRCDENFRPPVRGHGKRETLPVPRVAKITRCRKKGTATATKAPSVPRSIRVLPGSSPFHPTRPRDQILENALDPCWRMSYLPARHDE